MSAGSRQRLAGLRRRHPGWKFWIAWDDGIVGRYPGMPVGETLHLADPEKLERAIAAWQARNPGLLTGP